MKIEVIDIYKEKYKSAYLVHHKDNRKRVYLVGYDGSRKGMSYACYLWEGYNNQQVPSGMQVDHINNDKTDDRLENLQLLTPQENVKKYVDNEKDEGRIVEYVKKTCPICGKEFNFLRRNRNIRPNPSCSKECGYKKMILTRNKNKEKRNVS